MNHVIGIPVYLFINMRNEIVTSIIPAPVLLAGELERKMIYRARMLVQAGSKVIFIYTYLINALG